MQGLFETALALPVEDRLDWFDREVVEPAVRSEVLALVEAHESEGPLDQIAAMLAQIGQPDVGESQSDGLDDQRIGPYAVEELIGSGGMATVYRARLADDGEALPVALKVLRREAASLRTRRRFMAERQILAGLDHENIADFLDDGLTPDGLPYLVTELVEGDPLDRHCERHDVDQRGRLHLILQVCRAVAYAHSRGIVHRDLKPRNVLVTPGGEIRLLDFGIAKILDHRAFPGLAHPTTTGVQVMTLTYASPEQLLGEPVTWASDVYQLGLLLLELFSGRVPPAHRRISGSVTFELSSIGPSSAGGENGGGEVDERLVASVEPIVRKALSFRPEDRHASVEGLALDVTRALEPRRR